MDGGYRVRGQETDAGWESATNDIVAPVARWDPPTGWRAPLVDAVAATFAWNRDDEGTAIFFWHPDVGWQVEFSTTGVLFRRRRLPGEYALADADVLRPFCGTPAVIHDDDENWWTLPDELPDDASMYG
ncbi:MAG: hypothetical protein DHS20C19_01610 [Acidimicrobiales bacterium]|nr:MAG: hypothetical protein DHS20C19_01610 [Acidimicrobiales bacterium]